VTHERARPFGLRERGEGRHAVARGEHARRPDLRLRLVGPALREGLADQVDHGVSAMECAGRRPLTLGVGPPQRLDAEVRRGRVAGQRGHLVAALAQLPYERLPYGAGGSGDDNPSAILTPTEPLCWLTSSEDVFRSEPRACYRLASLEWLNGRDVLFLRIDPPAIGQRFGSGQDIDAIAVTPGHTGLSVKRLSPLPFDVHLLLFDDGWTADRRSVVSGRPAPRLARQANAFPECGRGSGPRDAADERAAGMSCERVLRAWFQAWPGPSLGLPNGWFGGRYGENQHEVTFLAERRRKLLIELDGRQLLLFTGIPTVEDRVGDGRRELVLRDFLQLTFDWEEYGGDGNTHVWRFTEGEVMFASPLRSSRPVSGQ
jgi:hypothetical protein